MKKWGIYSPNRKLAVRLICQSDRTPVDRPVDRQRSKIRPLEQPSRPPGRPKQTQSTALSSGRPWGWPAHCAAKRAQGCACRSTCLWCGRPLRSTDQAWQPVPDL